MSVVDWRIVRAVLGRGISKESILDHLNRESVPLLRALQVATNHILTERYNVLRFGAKGDGSADDTQAIQNAFDTAASYGGGEVVFPLTGHPYLISAAISVGSNTSVRRAFVTQRASENAIFQATGASNILIENCTLTGTGGSLTKSGNYAFYGLGCDKVRVVDCNFSAFQYSPLRFDGGSRITVKSCNIAQCALGIRLRGVNRSLLFDNTISDPSIPSDTFATVIFLDSTDGHSLGVCNNVRIVGNHVEGWPNCQAIELHSGTRIAIKGNVMDGVLDGIALNPFNAADVTGMHDIDIEGNLYVGTTTVAGTNGNYGIAVQGDPILGQVAHVTVRGNIIRGANAAWQFDGEGGIRLNNTDDIIVESNILTGCYGAGIVLSNSTNVRVHANTVRDTVSIGGRNTGIYITTTGCSGTISKNVLRNVTDAIRAGAVADQLSVERDNIFVSVSNQVANVNNLIAQGSRYFDPATTGDFTLDVGNGRVTYVDITPTSGAARCTNFTNAKDGQEVTVVSRNSNLTLDRGIFAEYDNLATWSGPGMISLHYVGALGYWQESWRYPTATAYKRDVIEWKKDVDGGAGAATAEKLIGRIVDAGTIEKFYFVPEAGLTADNTNNARIRVYFRDGAGGAPATVVDYTTTVANGDWTAWIPKDLGASNTACAAGQILSVDIIKNGGGVVVPAGKLVPCYRRT